MLQQIKLICRWPFVWFVDLNFPFQLVAFSKKIYSDLQLTGFAMQCSCLTCHLWFAIYVNPLAKYSSILNFVSTVIK